MEERQASRQHKIILTNRGTCALNGISDILSFDVNEILLETEMGMLMIRRSRADICFFRGSGDKRNKNWYRGNRRKWLRGTCKPF